MTEIANFTQPDVSPTYFIDFLELLDNLNEIQRVRAEFNNRMNLGFLDKVLDLGCGIGGPAFPIAEGTGPTGPVAGIDISSAMIEVANRRARNRPEFAFRIADACTFAESDRSWLTGNL